LIERISVGRAAPWIENLVVDPRKTTRPPIFLELMQRENGEVQEQNDHRPGESN